jgi:ribosomal protein S18 acetylase RimI-like enzyme
MPEDAEAVAALRNSVSDNLTFQHGRGWWTGHCTTAGVLFTLRHAQVYVTLRRGEAVATLVLATRKPWAIDLKYFTTVKRPLYLTSMAVAPELQRQGLGRACLVEAVKLARRAGAEALFLDAYDHVAGAGEFYRKCGFRETGRARYRGTPLVYFELLLGPTP